MFSETLKKTLKNKTLKVKPNKKFFDTGWRFGYTCCCGKNLVCTVKQFERVFLKFNATKKITNLFFIFYQKPFF